MQSVCQAFYIARCKCLTIDACSNEIRHTADFCRSHDRQPGAHCFVDSQTPGFVFRRQHEQVGGAVDLRQDALVRETMEMNIFKSEASSQFNELSSHLTRSDHHDMKADSLILQAGSRSQDIIGMLAGMQ